MTNSSLKTLLDNSNPVQSNIAIRTLPTQTQLRLIQRTRQFQQHTTWLSATIEKVLEQINKPKLPCEIDHQQIVRIVSQNNRYIQTCLQDQTHGRMLSILYNVREQNAKVIYYIQLYIKLKEQERKLEQLHLKQSKIQFLRKRFQKAFNFCTFIYFALLVLFNYGLLITIFQQSYFIIRHFKGDTIIDQLSHLQLVRTHLSLKLFVFFLWVLFIGVTMAIYFRRSSKCYQYGQELYKFFLKTQNGSRFYTGLGYYFNIAYILLNYTFQLMPLSITSSFYLLLFNAWKLGYIDTLDFLNRQFF